MKISEEKCCLIKNVANYKNYKKNVVYNKNFTLNKYKLKMLYDCHIMTWVVKS